MTELPHLYRASARSAAEAETVTLEAPGIAALESAGPIEFDGPGDRWSPETMLPALVGDCFILSFKAVAAASRFAWSDIECSIEAVVDKVERTMRFTEFRLRVELTIAADGDEERALKLLDKAERICIVSNSLVAPVHTTFAVARA